MQDQCLFTVASVSSRAFSVTPTKSFGSKTQGNVMAAQPVRSGVTPMAATFGRSNGTYKGLTVSMSAADSFNKIGRSINKTLDNASANLNSILNGNPQPQFATSAGPMSMDAQNIMAFQNAGQQAPSNFKTPATGGFSAA